MNNNHSQLVELCPPHYDCFNQPMVSCHGEHLKEALQM